MGADDISGTEHLHGAGTHGLLANAQMGHAQRLAGGVGLPETLVEAAALIHIFVKFQQQRKLCHMQFLLGHLKSPPKTAALYLAFYHRQFPATIPIHIGHTCVFPEIIEIKKESYNHRE